MISSSSVVIQRFDNGHFLEREDAIAIEEPLEIRLGYDEPDGKRSISTISITMRTPGDDADLALGFLYTEGIIGAPGHVETVKLCGPLSKTSGSQNVVRVELKPGVCVDMERLKRHFYTSSSCGVCGKTSIDALKVQRPRFDQSDDSRRPLLRVEDIHDLPNILREQQKVFARTGGLHASALFTFDKKLVLLQEDVGRHNALDKVIGKAFARGILPLRDHVLLVSGRASFELVQKAQMAGIEIFLAVGAPSSLAIELAREHDTTLIGFLRGQRMNVYHGAWRVRG